MFTKKFPSILLVSIGLLIFPSPVTGQIIPDQSLNSENSRVIRNIQIKGINSDRIDGGARRGDSLFHSFKEFNISPGRGAYFTSPTGVYNILNRVTGNNISNINGTLGVLGNANLFFMNPNGIIFGNGAKLDLSGSFFGTTANSILVNNIIFSAKNPQNVPIIRHNFVPGLGFGVKFEENSGDINVKAVGHKLKYEPRSLNPISGKKPSNDLQVESQQDIILLGNNVNLEGAVLTAEGGKIQIGAVKEGFVSFNSDNSLNFDKIIQFGDINFKNNSLIDVSSPNYKNSSQASIKSGLINFKAENIRIINGSILLNDNNSLQTGENINLVASESFTMRNKVNLPTQILSVATGEGRGGNIVISAPKVEIDNSALVSSVHSENGHGGTIIINSNYLNLLSGGSIGTLSILGKGGDTIIDNRDKIFINGNFSSTDSGDTGIRNITMGFDRGGNLIVTTEKLLITNGGGIGSTVAVEAFARKVDSNLLFQGRGGEVIIKAKEITVTGTFILPFKTPEGSGQSLRLSKIENTTFGKVDAGKISITTSRLKVENGAEISSTTFTDANAGNLNVSATDSILIKGGGVRAETAPAEVNFRKVVNLPELPSGFSGNLSLNTPNLKVSNNGSVSVGNFGSGNAGSLHIKTVFLNLNNQGSINATSVSGLGGTISIAGYQPHTPTELISLNNGSEIETNNSTTTDPNRGTIDIYTRDRFCCKK